MTRCPDPFSESRASNYRTVGALSRWDVQTNESQTNATARGRTAAQAIGTASEASETSSCQQASSGNGLAVVWTATSAAFLRAHHHYRRLRDHQRLSSPTPDFPDCAEPVRGGGDHRAGVMIPLSAVED